MSVTPLRPDLRKPEGEYVLREPPQARYRLILTNGFEFHLLDQPAWFHRLWARVLLGWVWEPLP